MSASEPTRDDLAAQLAAVTAERDALAALRPRDPHRTGHRCACCDREGAPGADDVCPWCSDGMATQRERDALRAELDGEHDLIARQSSILTAVADALKGPPPALSSHSHHDLGAVAAATVAQLPPLVACVDALRAAATAAGWRDADASGETLVAWVRRGAMRECLAVARTEQGVPDGARLADFNAVECAARIADGIANLTGDE